MSRSIGKATVWQERFRKTQSDGRFRSSGDGFFELIHKILRRAPRVRMKEPNTVELVSEVTGKRVEAIMIDISASGLGLFVLEEVEATLADTQAVQCNFSLPDMHERLSLPSEISLRQLDGAQVRYGLQFDQEDPNYEDQAEAIRDFVMTKQLGELQNCNR